LDEVTHFLDSGSSVHSSGTRKSVESRPVAAHSSNRRSTDMRPGGSIRIAKVVTTTSSSLDLDDIFNAMSSTHKRTSTEMSASKFSGKYTKAPAMPLPPVRISEPKSNPPMKKVIKGEPITLDDSTDSGGSPSLASLPPPPPPPGPPPKRQQLQQQKQASPVVVVKEEIMEAEPSIVTTQSPTIPASTDVSSSDIHSATIPSTTSTPIEEIDEPLPVCSDPSG
jgi:hypothetical protein